MNKLYRITTFGTEIEINFSRPLEFIKFTSFSLEPSYIRFNDDEDSFILTENNQVQFDNPELSKIHVITASSPLEIFILELET